MEKVNIFWFRRDLRIDDNHGLFQALNAGLPVVPVFIFDPAILAQFPDPKRCPANLYSPLPHRT